MIIEKIVTDFIHQDVDGALFINGPWGIGKSHFWKYNLAPLLNAEYHRKTKKNYKCLYVSLNGINDLNAIYFQLLQQKFPNNKWNILTRFTSRAAKIARHVPWLKNNLSEDMIAAAVSEFSTFETNIICFDDLERIGTQLKQEEVLGFLNTHFVELKKIKTVVIGWEKEIASGDQEQMTKYHLIKEKIFYRTIEFPPDLVGLREIIPKYTNNVPYHKFLIQHADYIELLQKKYHQPNLRTLIFSLDSLQVIFDAIIETKPGDRLMISIIFFVLIISFEFKCGRLTSSDSIDFKNLEGITTNYDTVITERILRAHRKSAEGQKNITPRYDEEFYDRYRIADVDEFYFFRSIYTYVLSGYLKKESIINDLDAYNKFEQTTLQDSKPEKVAADVISRPFRVDDEAYFREQVDQFLSNIDQGKYYYNEYGIFYDYLIRLKDNGLIDLTESEIRLRILEGCKAAFNNYPFTDQYLDQLPDRMLSKDGDVNNLISSFYQQLLQRKEKKKITDYIRALHGPEDDFTKRYLHFNPFAFLSAKQIFDELIKATIPSLRNFYSYLETQTDTADIKSKYAPFEPEIKSLVYQIKNHVFGENEKLRRYHFKLLQERLQQLY